MKPDIFGHLKEHYISVAKELSSQASQAGLLTNPTGVGTGREEVYRAFLDRHLPKMCDVFLGGYVFDLKGNSSSQIDVIVTSGNTPRFRMSSGNRYIAPLEGTIAVAEVKSKLDKTTLFEALRDCAKVPLMPDPSGIISPNLSVNRKSWDDTPYKIVIAYDAIEKETLWQHITTFYQENSEIPTERRPNIIHIVDKYVVMRILPDMQVVNSDGTIPSEQPEVGQYRWFDNGQDVLAMTWTLETIRSNAFIAQNSMYKYDAWIDEITNSILTGTPARRRPT